MSKLTIEIPDDSTRFDSHFDKFRKIWNIWMIADGYWWRGQGVTWQEAADNMMELYTKGKHSGKFPVFTRKLGTTSTYTQDPQPETEKKNDSTKMSDLF